MNTPTKENPGSGRKPKTGDRVSWTLFSGHNEARQRTLLQVRNGGLRIQDHASADHGGEHPEGEAQGDEAQPWDGDGQCFEEKADQGEDQKHEGEARDGERGM